jgi:hypothetical protein
MTQNMRNEPSDRQRSSGRGSNETPERRNYEGFEGMNYEQKRQPYNPQHTSNSRGNDSDSNRKRREEL